MYDVNAHLAELRAQAQALLDTAIKERRPDLNAAEDRLWRGLLEEMRAIKAEAESTSATPLEGAGWRVSSSPRWPHRDLQGLAEQIVSICWPWSRASDWRWRFGTLDGRFENLEAVTLYRPRLVVIDEAKLARHGDIESALQDDVLHEGSHIQVGTDGPGDPLGEPLHSNMFYRVLNEARTKCPRVICSWTRSRRM
jgi:hypothetical protein